MDQTNGEKVAFGIDAYTKRSTAKINLMSRYFKGSGVFSPVVWTGRIAKLNVDSGRFVI